MDIIEYKNITRYNIQIFEDLEPNKAVLVCNQYIMEQLSQKGVTFEEMYPGVFIVTSINGHSKLQDIEKIDGIIKLCNRNLIDEGYLVSQMSQEKMDTFFQNYFWNNKDKKIMRMKSVKYNGEWDSIDHPGYITVTYQKGKKGREFTYRFSDGATQLLGYTADNIRIEDVWEKYLFDETIKTWLEKNKLRLSLGVYDSSTSAEPENGHKTPKEIEAQMQH